MIKFIFAFTSEPPAIIPEQYPEILKYEGNFSIEIDNKVFFYDTNFSIFEFLLYTEKWKFDDDMQYISLETDENPLISFLQKDGLFYIKSPWSLFEYEKGFTKNELLDSLDIMKKDLRIET